MLLGMDWLYLHRTNVDFYDKAIKCLDENGEPRVVQGKKKATSVRMVTPMQEKHSHRKGCMLLVVHISSEKGKEVEDVKFTSMFWKEVFVGLGIELAFSTTYHQQTYGHI